MASVRYRPFGHGDFQDVARLIGETWWRDADFASMRQLAGEKDLATCLRRTTWAEVAVGEEGQLAGFMLVRAGDAGPEHDARCKRQAEESSAKLHAVAPETADLHDAYMAGEDTIHEKLLAQSGCDERFEVVTFIVAPGFQGRGAGRALLEHAEAEIASKGADEYFLYTDDACNWGFYEHMGLRCAATYETSAEERELMLPGYYLFTGDPRRSLGGASA